MPSLKVLRCHFQSLEERHGEHDARDAPKSESEPYGQQDDKRADIEPLADEQWLHELTLDQMKAAKSARHGERLTDAIERDESCDRETSERRDGTQKWNKVEDGGHGPP